MSDAPVPAWVHKLVDGLMTYDAGHPKLYYETGAAPGQWFQADCPCHLLAAIPEQAKRDARMFMDGARTAAEELEAQTVRWVQTDPVPPEGSSFAEAAGGGE